MAMMKLLRPVFIFSFFAITFYVLLVNSYSTRYTLSKQGIWEKVYYSKDTNISKVLLPLSNNSSVAPTTILRDKKILLWVPPICQDCAPFPAYKDSNKIFKRNKCKYQNCYITPNYGKLSHIDPENYDALMFNGRPTLRMGLDKLPKKRRDDQVYIFVQLESAVRFPVCQSYFDDFFNWTVTYKLDSDIPWTYFEVKTKDNITIAPSKNTKWVDDGDSGPSSDDLLSIISNKTKMAAWFVSNCHQGNSGRMGFVNKLNRELQRINRKMTVDIYGKCGQYQCYRNESERCNKLIEKDYMFYMAMENSFDEDYITEKVMTGLQNNAVPVVYSAVNYSRFLPPGSYLDGADLGPEKLAKKMIQLFDAREEYARYFRWQREYTYSDNFSNANVACKICERLNTDKNTTRHLRFREWWKKDFANKCK